MQELKIDVREQLLKFHEANYSANQVVISRNPIGSFYDHRPRMLRVQMIRGPH